MACLEVTDVPSASSTDDLGLLVAQFAAVRRMLLLSNGPGTPGSALVWLEEGADVSAAADALDCHPLAGGLVSVSCCEDAMRWVISRCSDQLLRGSSISRSASQTPQAPSPAQAPAPVPAMHQALPALAQPPNTVVSVQPLQQPASSQQAPAGRPVMDPPPPARSSPATPALPPSSVGSGGSSSSGRTGGGGGPSAASANGNGTIGGLPGGGGGPPGGADASRGSASGGVAAMEAELRELQQQLQQQALTGELLGAEALDDEAEAGWTGGSGGGGVWERGSSGSGSDAGWQQAGRGGARHRSGGGGAGGEPTGRIVVHNLQPGLTKHAIKAFFKQFGWVNECIPMPEFNYAFVHFADPSAATAAIRAVHGKMVLQLNPDSEVTAEHRDAQVARAARQAAGGGKMSASQVPTTKLWVGNVSEEATLSDLERVFGRFGPVFALELRQAPQAGRRDQWGFVNFRRLEDAQAAYENLQWRSIPRLSQSLKVQYRPV